MTTWLKDDNGNKCSVEFFGTTEEAQKALDSLKECKNCINCSGCSGCSGCSRCSGCSDCSRCSRCSRCSDCSGCSHVAWLRDKENLQTDPDKIGTPVGPPPVPTIENIHQRVYEAASAPASLDMSTWHTCDNTHCRAGWIVTLAGPAGKALEAYYDTPLAAMKIYDASSALPKVSPVRFFEVNDTALADMKRMAELEAGQA